MEYALFDGEQRITGWGSLEATKLDWERKGRRYPIRGRDFGADYIHSEGDCPPQLEEAVDEPLPPPVTEENRFHLKTEDASASVVIVLTTEGLIVDLYRETDAGAGDYVLEDTMSVLWADLT